MNTPQDKWDNTYRAQSLQPIHASDVLIQNQHLLPAKGIAVDLACGLGGNALFLAQSGLNTHAWDISPVAIDKCRELAHQAQLTVCAQVRDIEQCPPEKNQFDVVVLTHFLHRPTFAHLIKTLKSGGCLFYQTFVEDKNPDVGPSNKDYLLQSNELLQRCQGMHILAYREERDQGDRQLGWRNQAMIVARKL
jgi:SAM-dependent methyltransferase